MDLTYTVSIPSDQGFFGRQCGLCNKYFKIYLDDFDENERLYCPYCGIEHETDQLWTDRQVEVIDQIAEDIGMKVLEDHLDQTFGEWAKQDPNVTYSPGEKTKVSLPNHHLEQGVDSEIKCSDCNSRFQVFGVFGYCPGCKGDNINIYDVNIQIILNELAHTETLNRSLRHAYNDLVATFESYCKKVAVRKNMETVNFQNIKNTKDFFKQIDIDIYSGISESEKITIKRVFEKRHLYQHGDGVIEERYIKNIPYDRNLIGQKAILTKEEFLAGVDVLKKVLKNIG